MGLYMNNELIGYQATMHGEDGGQYVCMVMDEAPAYLIERELRRSGESLQELVEGELTP